jgi:hypothetical protein
MDEPAYSWRDGLREGVAFLLTDRQRRVLLEWRPDKDGNHTDVFFPSGSIEMKDHRPGVDYREVALLREIGEEFRGGVAVERVHYLGEVKVPAIGLTFYTYWIAAWSGDAGEWTWEDGAPHARLLWATIDEAVALIPWDTGAEMAGLLKAAMASTGAT